MAKTFRSLIAETKQDLLSLADHYSELYRLKALEKGVPKVVRWSYLAFIGVVVAFFFLFLCLTLVFGLSLLFVHGAPETALQSLALASLCFTGVLLLIIVVLILLRTKVCGHYTAKIISKRLDALEQREQDAAAMQTSPTEQATIATGTDTDIVQLD